MSALVDVGRGHSLSPEAAASWKRMVAAGMPDAGLTSSTRSLARQRELYANRGKPGWPKYAAHPDESKHVWRPADKRDRGGRAVDVNDPTRSWLVKHGRAHGWHRPFASVEPWHFEYDITLDQHLEDDMPTAKEIVDELLSRRITHTAGQKAASNRDSATVERILGDTSAGGFRAWKDLPRVDAQIKQVRARLTALEKAVSRGVSVSARDVARELEPLLADDIREGISQAVANLPERDATTIAQAVASTLAARLAGTDED